MGLTLACVMVLVEETKKESKREQIIDETTRMVLDGPYFETSDKDDNDPDRYVNVSPSGEGRWLTIFDSAGDLRSLAKSLSTRINGTAIYINLIDSDVIHLRRYTQGSSVDDYCNNPTIYDLYSDDPDRQSDWGDLTEEELKSVTQGDLSKWRDLFLEGGSIESLSALWQSRPVFADDILWATAYALGMDKDEIFHADQSTEFEQLTFRLSEPRRYEIEATGPPLLELVSYAPEEEYFVDYPFMLSITAQNNGKSSKGAHVAVYGDGIDQGLVEIEKVILRSHDPEMVAESKFIKIKATSEGKEIDSWLGHLPDFELPQGLEGGNDVLLQKSVSWQKAFEALDKTRFSVSIVGTARRTGRGNIYQAIMPAENPIDGRVSNATAIVSYPGPRRPLRSVEARHLVQPFHLRNLETPVHLFGLIVMGTDQASSAERAGEEIKAWANLISAFGEDRLKVSTKTDVAMMPTERKLRVDDIKTVEFWDKQTRELGNCMSFRIDGKSSQVLFDNDPMFFQNSKYKPAPHFAVWFTVADFDEGTLITIEEWIVDVIDRLMLETNGLQAMVGKWDWFNYPNIYVTPYEVATGIGSTGSTSDYWCQKYLRGVTEHLWLGPDLISKIDDVTQLSTLAKMTQIDRNIRVDLHESSDLGEFEKALASILPSEQNWLDGYEEMFRRIQRNSDS